MKKVSTPTNIKRFLICYSPSEIEHFCKDKEVDVLHITANVESRITGSFDYNEVEFGCPIPKAFEVNEDNPYFTTIDGVLFSKDKKILVAFPKRDDDYEYTIPDGVTCIGYEAFVDQRHLTSIHIPDSVSKWAMIMNVSRPSLHRELKMLESRGLISYTPPIIKILQLDALQDVLN